MDITLDMFAAICIAEDIIPGFLKIAQGFDRKFRSNDEDFMACYSNVSVDEHDPTIGNTSSTTEQVGDGRTVAGTWPPSPEKTMR